MKYCIFSQFGSGQTLIELLVALTIAGIVITSAGSVVISSLHNAQSVTSKTIAAKYAQEGMEILQQIRDADYAGFKNYSGTFCLGKNQATLGNPVGSCNNPNVDQFIRSVVISQNGCAANVAKITVIVAWQDTTCSANDYCQSVPLISCLSTVNPIQSP